MNQSKILVVEDSPVVLKVYQRKLEALGYSVTTASSSGVAVGRLRAETPDLILLDLSLPDPEGFGTIQWDGLKLIEWVQGAQAPRRIPFIVITSSHSPQDRSKALSLGAAAYFNKSAPFEEITAAIAHVLGQPPAPPA